MSCGPLFCYVIKAWRFVSIVSKYEVGWENKFTAGVSWIVVFSCLQKGPDLTAKLLHSFPAQSEPKLSRRPFYSPLVKCRSCFCLAITFKPATAKICLRREMTIAWQRIPLIQSVSVGSLLTPWNTVLEKLIKLVKIFLPFYVTRRFITAFTSTRHLSPSRASSIQSIAPHPTS